AGGARRRPARLGPAGGRDVAPGRGQRRDRRAGASPGACPEAFGERVSGPSPGLERVDPERANLEREVKLAAPADFRLPLLTDGSGGVIRGTATDVEMTATYYDTPDLRLTRSGASLRYRTDEGWVVKLPEHREDAVPEAGIARHEYRFGGGP